MTEHNPAPTQTDDLLPCPFCGGSARTWYSQENGWSAQCNNYAGCAASIRDFGNAHFAIAAWNTRATPHAEAAHGGENG